jgi:hypothetical protein
LVAFPTVIIVVIVVGALAGIFVCDSSASVEEKSFSVRQVGLRSRLEDISPFFGPGWFGK